MFCVLLERPCAVGMARYLEIWCVRSADTAMAQIHSRTHIILIHNSVFLYGFSIRLCVVRLFLPLALARYLVHLRWDVESKFDWSDLYVKWSAAMRSAPGESRRK